MVNEWISKEKEILYSVDWIRWLWRCAFLINCHFMQIYSLNNLSNRRKLLKNLAHTHTYIVEEPCVYKKGGREGGSGLVTKEGTGEWLK